MRTIKFRGLEANPYCEELRTFLYGTPLFITNEENYILPNFWDYEGLNKFKVLKKTISQFTGLHDKNGKEIYEGDIVSYKRNVGNWTGKSLTTIHEIIFTEEINAFVMKDNSSYIKLRKHWGYEYEVIGNIYENPELLKSDGEK